MTAKLGEEQRAYARLYVAPASSLVMNPKYLGYFPKQVA